MTDWAPAGLGRFAGHGDDLHDRFGRKGDGGPGAGMVSQARAAQGPQVRVAGLSSCGFYQTGGQGQPAGAPVTHGGTGLRCFGRASVPFLMPAAMATINRARRTKRYSVVCCRTRCSTKPWTLGVISTTGGFGVGIYSSLSCGKRCSERTSYLPSNCMYISGKLH